MQTQTIQTFTFAELSEEAKQKAIEDVRNDSFYMSWKWYDFIFEAWKEKLEKEGYYKTEIHFSGFNSQGDGANFTATVNLAEWLEGAQKKSKYKALYTFAQQNGVVTNLYRQSHRYEHEMVINIDTELYCYNELSNTQEKQLVEVEELILTEARGYMKDIYRELEKDYDYQTSDEAITDFLEVNEYQFLVDGNRTYCV